MNESDKVELIYHFTTEAMFDLGILIAMIFAYQWRQVIGASLVKLLPGKLGDRMAALCKSRWGLLLSIPALVIVILLLLLRQVGNWSSHFELTKRVAAELFRYQLESAIDKSATAEFLPIPEEYRKSFPLVGTATAEQLLGPFIPGLDEIRGILKNWQNETNLIHSLAVVGLKGSGKTCLLDYLERNIRTEQSIRCAVPAKLTTRKQVLEFFGGVLNLPLTENLDALRKTGSDNRKILVLVDDC